jgi:hypothetical protein
VHAAAESGLTQDVAPADTVADGSGISALSSSVAVDVPLDPSTPVVAADASGAVVGIGLPEEAASGSGTPAGDAVVFQNPGQGTSTTVQPLADGSVRASVTIGGADSPESYSFPLDLPDGAHADVQPDGSVAITSQVETTDEDGSAHLVDTVTSRFAVPWAVDANGAPVPTTYTVDGDTLTQHVAITPGTAFPVVADPFWSTVWHVAKCVASITVAVASLAIPLAKLAKLRAFVRAVGGISEAARLLAGATTWAEKARVIGKAIGAGAADILGISAIIDNC